MLCSQGKDSHQIIVSSPAIRGTRCQRRAHGVYIIRGSRANSIYLQSRTISTIHPRLSTTVATTATVNDGMSMWAELSLPGLHTSPAIGLAITLWYRYWERFGCHDARRRLSSRLSIVRRLHGWRGMAGVDHRPSGAIKQTGRFIAHDSRLLDQHALGTHRL